MKSPRKQLYYLASPISHENPMVIDMRHSQCVQALTQFYHHGWMVYSPHVHHYPIASQMPKTWEFWEGPSFGFLDRCDGGLIVLMLGDWEKSQGVAAEMERAKENNQTIMFVDYPLEWTQPNQIRCSVISYGILQPSTTKSYV